MFNRTRTIVLTAILALLVAAPAATAQTAHKYNATVMSSPISTANGYPSPGGHAVLAGSILSPQFGPGSVLDTVAVTAQSAPNVFTFSGVEVDYFGDGTLRNLFTGTATIQPDGSQDIVLKGRFTRGSGRYTGATGSYTFTGTTPPGSSVTTGTSSGSVAF